MPSVGTATRRAMTTSAYVALALAFGCGNSERQKAGPTVQVVVDEDAAVTVTVDRAIPLRSVVSPAVASWLEVRGETSGGQWIELPTKGSGSEIRLYLDQGRPAIGTFVPVTADMPPEIARIASQPTASLPDIATVRVITKRPPLSSIVVEVAGVATTLAGEKLWELPGIRGEKHVQGWALADVIDLASQQPANRAEVIGATTLPIAAFEPNRLYVLKLNQRGEYVFRVWERGARTPMQEVRRVAKIVVP